MVADKIAESVAEAKDGLFDAWKARLEHPILGAFVLYWLIWNYHVAVVLFSDGSFESKLGYLHRTYHLDTACGRFQSAIWPLIFALLTPFMEVVLAAIWRSINTAKRVVGDIYDRSDLSTPTQVKKIREEYERQLNDKDAEIKKLTDASMTAFNAQQHMQYHATTHANMRFHLEGEAAFKHMGAGRFKVPEFTASTRADVTLQQRRRRLLEMVEGKGLSPEHVKTLGLVSEVPMGYVTYVGALNLPNDPSVSEPFFAMLVWAGAISVNAEPLTEPSLKLTPDGAALKDALDRDPDVQAWRQIGRHEA